MWIGGLGIVDKWDLPRMSIACRRWNPMPLAENRVSGRCGPVMEGNDLKWTCTDSVLQAYSIRLLVCLEFSKHWLQDVSSFRQTWQNISKHVMAQRLFKKTPQIEEALYSSRTLTVVWLGTVWRDTTCWRLCLKTPGGRCVKLVIPFFPRTTFLRFVQSSVAPQFDSTILVHGHMVKHRWLQRTLQTCARVLPVWFTGIPKLMNGALPLGKWNSESEFATACFPEFKFGDARVQISKLLYIVELRVLGQQDGCKWIHMNPYVSWMNPYESVLDDGCKYVCPWMPWDVVCLCTLCT